MFGKGIRFHYTYIILAISYVLTGYFLNLIVFSSLIIIHEFSHCVVAKLLCFNVREIIIYPFGGITKIDDMIDRDINHELLIACAGVIGQFSFYLFIYFLYKIGYIRGYTFNLFSYYNNYIIFFNLLPIIPLDGYKIVNLLLNKYFYLNLANYISVVVSVIIIIIVIGVDIYSLNYSNIMIFSLVIWYLYSFISKLKYLYERFLLERYLYNNNYNKLKSINSIKKMYRNRRHLLYGCIEEKKYLFRLFNRF